MTRETFDNLKNAKTNEEFKHLVEGDEIELTDENLAAVGGGLIYLDTDEIRKA